MKINILSIKTSLDQICNIVASGGRFVIGASLLFVAIISNAQQFLQDESKAYSMPMLTKTPKGEVLLSWTEKDAEGKTALCMALSKDNGKTFAGKKTIASGYGVSNNRLMRAKVLAKKDGSFVAVFMNNPNATPPAAGGGNGGRGGGGGGRGGQVAYCTSKDGGSTWAAPQPVDTDPTPNLMRGFFDAIVLANDEVAVTYLKDVKNSTKHEERDLRMSITKNGVFQAEKLIDAVVCDCCNISLLVDNKGILNVYYRDNNNDIRDIAKMTSTDNGATFSKSEILYKDNWQIAGCPHNGAVSTAFGNTNLITWFSAAETEKGIRLVTQDGKKLSLINDPSAKNTAIAADAKNAVFLWEQTNPANNSNQVAYQVMGKPNTLIATRWIDQVGSYNVTGIIADNQLLVAYEVKNATNKNSIKISSITL
jgi:BNR repeat-like domain